MLIEVKSGNGNSGNNQDQDFGYNQYVNLFKKGSIGIDYLCDEKILIGCQPYYKNNCKCRKYKPNVSKLINEIEYIKIINVKTALKKILNGKEYETILELAELLSKVELKSDNNFFYY